MRPILHLLLTSILLQSPGWVTAQRITPDEILFKTQAASPKPTLIDGIQRVAAIVPVRPYSKPAPVHRIYRATVSPDRYDHVLSELRSRPDVVYAQPNHVFETFQAANDPKLSDQRHLDLIDWSTLIAALPDRNKDIVVGVIDSGIDYDHEDLASRVWVNEAEQSGRANVDDDGNGYVDDVYGWDFTDAPTLPGQGDFVTPDNDPNDESSHGTGVAGVIAAEWNNGIGVAGVADCQVMAVRAGLSFDQGGTFLQEDDLAAGIIYAVDNGADILNLSWGSFDRSFVIEDAVNYATERGVIVVAAAGNAGTRPVAYPAALDNVISVGAVDDNGQRASFGSYGAILDLVAPGVNIVSTRPNDEYGPRSGTSFAAPQISGLAALLLSRDTTLTPPQVRSALVAATTDLGSSGWDFVYGSGQTNAPALLSETTIAARPTVSILSPGTDDDVAATTTIRAAVSPDATAYRLSWSIDSDEVNWTQISTGTPTDTMEIAWEVPSDLQDTSVVLRLEADGSSMSRPIEHRVQVRAAPAPPEFTSLFLGPILTGDRVEWTARWTTDKPTRGHIELLHPDGITRDTLSTHKLDRFHEVVVPDPDQPTLYLFSLVAQTSSGVRGSTDPAELIVVPARLPTIGFTEIGSLPDGFLADSQSDFDNDGRPDIALMPYVEGQAFSPVEVYEFQTGGTFERIHTTEDAFLPWNVADVTFDGRTDLLGTSVARIRLFDSSLQSNALLDQSGVWGGEMGDADGDGANEIIARSLTDRSLRLFRKQETGGFAEYADLPDFSPGGGEIGSRFVIADLDKDSRHDLLVGDGDGDIWSYEFTSASFQPNLLIEGDDDTDARVVGGGEDLDDDGRIEFAVARAFENPDDALNGWWDLEIYEVSGSSVALEYKQRISGVAMPGNGIATGDLDGDGRPDLAVALIPDLYVLRGEADGIYRPMYHTDISLTYQPVITDFDDDGAAELVVNADNAVRILERSLPADTRPRPEIIKADQISEEVVRLSWMQVPDADAYRLVRTTKDSSRVIVEGLIINYFDETVDQGDTLTYRVDAIIGNETVSSSPVTVAVSLLPLVVDVTKLDEHRIGLRFNTEMSDAATQPEGYFLSPGNVRPVSAVRDEGSRRIVLTFPTPIDDGVTHTLTSTLATDLSGRLLSPAARSITFTPGLQSPVTMADFDSDGVVGFGDFLLFASAFGGTDPTYDFDDDGIVGFSDFLQFASVFGQTV